ncbi:MAG: hypothetical protein SOY42_12150 [Clostridium sp.]|nr:hypothetical protein [Clostridium sp.]
MNKYEYDKRFLNYMLDKIDEIKIIDEDKLIEQIKNKLSHLTCFAELFYAEIIANNPDTSFEELEKIFSDYHRNIGQTTRAVIKSLFDGTFDYKGKQEQRLNLLYDVDEFIHKNVDFNEFYIGSEDIKEDLYKCFLKFNMKDYKKEVEINFLTVFRNLVLYCGKEEELEKELDLSEEFVFKNNKTKTYPLYLRLQDFAFYEKTPDCISDDYKKVVDSLAVAYAEGVESELEKELKENVKKAKMNKAKSDIAHIFGIENIDNRFECLYDVKDIANNITNIPEDTRKFICDRLK